MSAEVPTAPEICGVEEVPDCEVPYCDVPDCEVPDCVVPDCELPYLLVSGEVLGVMFDVSLDVLRSVVVVVREEDDVPLIGSGDGVVCANVEPASSNAEPKTSKGKFFIILLLHE